MINFKTIHDFITPGEQEEIAAYAMTPPDRNEIQNEHIKKVNAGTNGWSVLCDLTNTALSKTVSKFQGDSTAVESVPQVYHAISDRIASAVGVSKSHVFFQYIALGAGGRVPSHYDAGVPGHITYKCNVCVEGPELDHIYVDRAKVDIAPLDLYCFEASL